MALRMLVIQPTKPFSLLTTTRELVVPVVAMFASFASSPSSWEEAENFLPDEHCKRMEVNEKGFSGTSFTKGLIDIADEHRARYAINPPTETVFLFSAGKAKAEVDLESKILTCTLSCNSPPRSMERLTTAIDHGFGPELDSVKFIVSEQTNEFEMRYCGNTLFKCEMKDAESLIPYAVGAARNLWLQALQVQLIHEGFPTNREAYARCVTSGALLASLSGVQRVGLRKHGLEADRIDRVFSPSALSKPQREKIANLVDLGAWGKKLTEELVHHWWVGSTPRRSWVQAAFQCSGSKGNRGVKWNRPTAFASNIQDYICSQLRKHTRQNDYDPEVIIRMRDKSWSFQKASEFFLAPFTGRVCAIECIDEATGNWISISDADGPGIRRVLLCRSSNFHGVFSDFLETTDFFKSRDVELSDHSAYCAEEPAKSGTEGSRSLIDESSKSGVTHLESMEAGRVPVNSWTDRLKEIVNEHMEENLDEQPETSPFIFGSLNRDLPDKSSSLSEKLAGFVEAL